MPAEATPPPPPVAAPEEEFYPPDHHMHASHQEAEPASQGELNLTTPPPDAGRETR
jgi:hypothetical protein